MIRELDRLLGATSAVRREAIRRDAGEDRDPRFDIPISMLLDLADDLFAPAADVDVLVEELHAGRPGLGIRAVGADGREESRGLSDQRAALDACTNDAACEESLHLSTCPRR